MDTVESSKLDDNDVILAIEMDGLVTTDSVESLELGDDEVILDSI